MGKERGKFKKKVAKAGTVVKEKSAGIAKEFLDFLKEYKVVGLAVAFIIGAASTSLVYAAFNSSGRYSDEIKKIMKERLLWAFTGNLYAPNKGVYIHSISETFSLFPLKPSLFSTFLKNFMLPA